MDEILKDILLKLNKLDTMESKLGNMENRFDTVENRFDSMESRFDTMENRFDFMESRFNTMENHLVNLTEQQSEANQRLTKIETKIENNINVKIQALFEDKQIVHDKLDKMQKDIKDIKTKVTNQDIKIQAIDNRTKTI